MINEGIITNDTKTLVKSEMIRQLHTLGATNPDTWERQVFQALTGHVREDVDWDIEDNQAGYYTWVKSFDGLVSELIEDGYIFAKEPGCLQATEAEPLSEYSNLVYPPRPSG